MAATKKYISRRVRRGHRDSLILFKEISEFFLCVPCDLCEIHSLFLTKF